MWRESHHRCWLDAKPVTGYMISFRFHYGDSHNIVVRTHRQHGSWGSEERHAPFFPFQPGQPFEMIVRCEHDKYMVSNSAFGQFMKGLTTPNFLLLQSCVLSVDCCQQPAHVRIPAPRSSYPPIWLLVHQRRRQHLHGPVSVNCRERWLQQYYGFL